MSNEFGTMKEIAAQYEGCTSHKVGRELKELGYRDDDGRPTRKAFAERMVEQRFASDRPVYLWAWNKNKVANLLETFGWQKVANDATAI